MYELINKLMKTHNKVELIIDTEKRFNLENKSENITNNTVVPIESYETLIQVIDRITGESKNHNDINI